jgi:hypothetical protein
MEVCPLIRVSACLEQGCYVLVQGNTVSAMGTHKGLKQGMEPGLSQRTFGGHRLRGLVGV